MSEWGINDVRDDGRVEIQGWKAVYVLPKETAARLGRELLWATGEPTVGELKGRYPALAELTNTENALSDLAYDLAYRAHIELLTLWGVFDKAESKELKRLRKIEAVCINVYDDAAYNTRERARAFWHTWEQENHAVSAGIGDAIADALEVES